MELTNFNIETGTTPGNPSAPGASAPRIPGYEILELLGRGGMGRVYKARHLGLDRMVAVKVLASGADANHIARFQAEALAVAQLQHPHIAQVYEAGAVDGQPFFAMEYLAGGSLAHRLARQPHDPRVAAEVVETLARAMQFCHERGILHRDLKPANVLLDSRSSPADGTATGNAHGAQAERLFPKIADFGLAKKIEAAERLTRTGEVLGTPSYMAPEQASGVVTKLGPAVDVYALGAILYEMLTGRPPFQAPEPVQTLMMVLAQEPVPPRTLQPSIPRDLDTICLKCLEKSPRKRYSSALALAEDLCRFREGQPIVARPASSWERLAKWARRQPAAAALVALGAASLIAASAGLVILNRYNRDLQTAIDETEASLAIAQTAVNRNLVRVAEELAPVPQSEHVRRESLEDARRFYERLAQIRPRNVAGKNHRAEAFGRLGQIYQDLGRLDDATTAYRQALAMFEAVQRELPEDAGCRLGRATVLNNLANIERLRGNADAALSLTRDSQAVLEPLLNEEASADALKLAATLHNNLGLTLRAQQDLEGADREQRAALKLRARLLEQLPDDRGIRADMAVSHSNLAILMFARERYADAVKELEQAEKLLQGQLAPKQRFYLGQVQGNLAVAFEELKMGAEAEKAHARTLATLGSLAADFSSVIGYRHVLAKAHVNLARYYGPQGRTSEAHKQLVLAQPLYTQLLKEAPDHAAIRADAALCQRIMQLVEEDLKMK